MINELAETSRNHVEDLGNKTKGPEGRTALALSPSDEFDCSLCLKIFFEPVTTPCGELTSLRVVMISEAEFNFASCTDFRAYILQSLSHESAGSQ